MKIECNTIGYYIFLTDDQYITNIGTLLFWSNSCNTIGLDETEKLVYFTTETKAQQMFEYIKINNPEYLI